MNLAQTIHIKACEAAATVPGDKLPHELATTELAAFNAQGFNPVDYPEWLVSFRAKRTQLRVAAEEEKQKLTHLGQRKTQSELNIEAEKLAAAAEAQKKAA